MNVDWKFIVTITVAVIFGIIAIVQQIIFARKKKPSWAYKTKKVIGLGSDAPKELKLMFGDTSVNEVYHTEFIFFTAGKEPIRGIEDVVKPTTVRFENAQILREPLIHPSNTDIEFNANRINDSIGISFKCLDYKDGAVFEVLHTKCDEPKCDQGKILGAPKITFLGEFEYASLDTIEKIFAGLIVPLTLISIALFVLRVLHTQWVSSDWFLIVYAISAFVLGGGIYPFIRFFKIRKFPPWSRKPWK